MHNVSRTTPSLLICFALTALAASPSLLYAQQYTLDVGVLPSSTLKSNQQGSLLQQLNYSIPLTIDPRQIADVIHHRPSSNAIFKQ